MENEPNNTQNPDPGATNSSNDDLKAALSTIENNVSRKVDEAFSKISDKMTPKKPDPDEDLVNFFNEDDDSEQEFVSKKDLPKIVEQVSSKLKKESDAQYEARTRKERRDMEALEEFPALRKNQPGYNPKFVDAVTKEMNRRIQSGHDENEPDLLYDAAASVAHKGLREGWYAPKEMATQQRNYANRTTDTFTVNPSNALTDEPTEEQLRLAKRYGMSEERYKKAREIIEKNRLTRRK